MLTNDQINSEYRTLLNLIIEYDPLSLEVFQSVVCYEKSTNEDENEGYYYVEEKTLSEI